MGGLSAPVIELDKDGRGGCRGNRRREAKRSIRLERSDPTDPNHCHPTAQKKEKGTNKDYTSTTMCE